MSGDYEKLSAQGRRARAVIIDAKGEGGNAFCVLDIVENWLEAAGRADEVEAVMTRMTASDYDNLCNVAEEVTSGEVKVVNR